MGTRTAENYVDYQQRATEFAVGDPVVPLGQFDSMAGRVVAVWPAIGMVDVEYGTGNRRYPVEDLQRLDPANTVSEPPTGNSVPGGIPTVSVPGGPHPQLPERLRQTTEEAEQEVNEAFGKDSSERVAQAFVRRALYWQQRDRQYRATKPEIDSGHFQCPKCRSRGQESLLRPAIYKRRGGQSEKLLGCQVCLFLVKKQDIVGHPDYLDAEEVA